MHEGGGPETQGGGGRHSPPWEQPLLTARRWFSSLGPGHPWDQPSAFICPPWPGPHPATSCPRPTSSFSMTRPLWGAGEPRRSGGQERGQSRAGRSGGVNGMPDTAPAAAQMAACVVTPPPQVGLPGLALRGRRSWPPPQGPGAVKAGWMWVSGLEGYGGPMETLATSPASGTPANGDTTHHSLLWRPTCPLPPPPQGRNRWGWGWPAEGGPGQVAAKGPM